jgi:hypothetical protein
LDCVRECINPRNIYAGPPRYLKPVVTIDNFQTTTLIPENLNRWLPKPVVFHADSHVIDELLGKCIGRKYLRWGKCGWRIGWMTCMMDWNNSDYVREFIVRG